MQFSQSMKKSDDNDLRSSAARIANQALTAWSGLVSVSVFVFFFISSFDFSFLLTLSSIISVFSFVMVCLTVFRKNDATGVSLRMMECYVIVFASRLCSIVPYEGYLPLDKSGDWFYQSCEFTGLVVACLICFLCRVRCNFTYDKEADTLPHLCMILPALLLALFLHPHLNSYMPADVAWTFALYLESITVLPQLAMFVSQEKTQPHISHFLGAQALSRLLSFIFWAHSFNELAVDGHAVKQYAGHWVMGVQLLQLIIMGDFIYRYVRCLQKGIPVSDLLRDTSVDFV